MKAIPPAGIVGRKKNNPAFRQDFVFSVFINIYIKLSVNYF